MTYVQHTVPPKIPKTTFSQVWIYTNHRKKKRSRIPN